MSEPFDPIAMLAKLREEFPADEGINAAEAARADREAEMDRAMNQRDYVTGSGAPPLEIVENMLGTPTGDMYADTYGLNIGDFSVEQFQAMHRNGMSWTEITKRAAGRRNVARSWERT